MCSHRVRVTPMPPCASIIIPAHNEARVIGNCLDTLLRDFGAGEFDIVVVCNGCTDDTEGVAMTFGERVRVFSIQQPSKVAALNLGDKFARTYPRVYLDSDLRVSGNSIRALVKTLVGEKLAAIGFMDVDFQNRSWLVRSFYRIWLLHPYHTQGKFGGVYALSKEGCRKRGHYPDIIADDAFVKNSFVAEEYETVPECRFMVSPPTTLIDVFRVRTRSYLGNLQLRDSNHATSGVKPYNRKGWLKRVAKFPNLWPGLPIYLVLNGAAKINALLRHRLAIYTWLRDESSRERAQPRTTA